MPFWWPRRNKWWSRGRYKYRRRRPYRRRTRKHFFRRRHRRTAKRRRRRRKAKVRRKKPFIKLLQWQPQSIRKCKIKGYETLLMGADGKQYRDYTSAMNEWIPPRVPGGGGLAISIYTLEYFYEQHLLHNNIWTTSNENYDLCRYTGCSLIFYRHPYIDFVCHYKREYPMTESAYTPMTTHPLLILQQRKKILIPSRITQPHGKNYIRKKIKVPRQQVNKWFFIRDYAKTPLLLLQTAACDLNFVRMGRQSENTLTNIYSLNIGFYSNGAFGQPNIATGHTYMPIHTQKYATGMIAGTDIQGKTFNTNMQNTYLSSVGYTTGWFTSKVLTSKTISTPQMQAKPIYLLRYNPNIDTGKGNKVWLKSIFADHWGPPATDLFLIFEDEPLWLSFYGWFDYINSLKPAYDIFNKYTLVIQSDYFQSPIQKQYIVPIDESFLIGNSAYDATVTDLDKTRPWIPTLRHQQKSINNIVKCGPFIPRPEGKLGNWELHLKYTFFFKWGGAQPPETNIYDPTKGSKYPVPDNFYKTVQITDPTKQIPQTILHTWDYRRGLLTQKALKRMYDNLSDKSTVSTDSECLEPPHKVQRSAKQPQIQEKETEVLKCLQQLYKENSCQETEEKQEEDLHHLIQQQQQQQQLIKHNLLKLITQMKKTQLQMQIQTGILP
nr:MAG: ORF1 [Torque teno midi virus]